MEQLKLRCHRRDEANTSRKEHRLELVGPFAIAYYDCASPYPADARDEH